MLDSFYYDNLSSQEKSIYGIIRSAISRSARECIVPCADVSSAQRAWEAVVLDQPDLINYPGIYWGSPQPKSGTVKFAFEYSDVDENIYSERLQAVVDVLNRKIKSSDSEYAVCKKIYDYLAANVKYDSAVLAAYVDLMRGNPPQSRLAEFMLRNSRVFSPYGVIVDKKGVCQGIAKTFKILCSKFGVQCACVSAETNDGHKYPHMLNVVELDGVSAYIDVVNGLPVEGLPMIRYDSFAVTTRIIQKNYDLETVFGCDDESVSYFSRNGLRFKNIYDLKRYLNAYTFTSTDGEVRAFYDGKDLSDRELRDLFADIINSHCDSYHVMETVSVVGGMCNGLLTNR